MASVDAMRREVAPLPEGSTPLPQCTRWARLELDVMCSPEFRAVSAGAKVLYSYLCAFINAETRSWSIRVKLLASYAGYSPAHVRRCLAELEDADLIARRATFQVAADGKRQGANTYTLTDPPSLRERRQPMHEPAPPPAADSSGELGAPPEHCPREVPPANMIPGPCEDERPRAQHCEAIYSPKYLPQATDHPSPKPLPKGGLSDLNPRPHYGRARASPEQVWFIERRYADADAAWWERAAAGDQELVWQVLMDLKAAREGGGGVSCRVRSIRPSLLQAARQPRAGPAGGPSEPQPVDRSEPDGHGSYDADHEILLGQLRVAMLDIELLGHDRTEAEAMRLADTKALMDEFTTISSAAARSRARWLLASPP